KGLKRQKEAKTIKNQQETGKRQRVKSKTKKSARNHSRISPTQSNSVKERNKEVKGPQNKVKGAKVVKCSKFQGLMWSIKDQGTKVAKRQNGFKKKKKSKTTTRTEVVNNQTSFITRKGGTRYKGY
ncbi:hypothetical protein Tco_1339354, partial [Tanacetum coccineum]